MSGHGVTVFLEKLPRWAQDALSNAKKQGYDFILASRPESDELNYTVVSIEPHSREHLQERLEKAQAEVDFFKRALSVGAASCEWSGFYGEFEDLEKFDWTITPRKRYKNLSEEERAEWMKEQ